MKVQNSTFNSLRQTATTVYYFLEGRSRWGTYALCGRVMNWRNLIMGAGTALAVMGFVVSYFKGMVIYCAGSFLLGVVTLFGGYYVRKFPTLLALNQLVPSLQRTNRDLRETSNRLSHETGVLKHENEELRRTREALQGIEGNLRTQVEQFSQRNTQLGAQIAQMQAAGSKIEQQVALLAQENLRFRNSLDGLDRRNDAFHARFGSDLSALEGQISLTRSLNQEIFAHVAKQKHDLSSQLQELNQLLADLRNKDFFPQQMAIITELRGQMEKLRKQSHELTLAITGKKTEFAYEEQELSRIRKELEETSQRLAHNVEQLKETRAQLDASVVQLREQVDRRIQAGTPATSCNARLSPPATSCAVAAGASGVVQPPGVAVMVC